MKNATEYLDHVEVEEIQNLNELLIRINRCAAVVKGGRRFSFSGLVVVGDREGVVGYGFGKARQVPGAIEKANKDARKHLQRVPLTPAGTITHEVIGRFCAAEVKLIPASPGTGIIAGSSVRAVAEMSGIKNLLSKSYGSTNPINLVKATLAALAQLRTAEQVATLRGVSL
ncbi:MAG: small subunit ribosomal protein S5 [Planctomycetota bacterium]|jgi:small subunit ribosomal protein S5